MITRFLSARNPIGKLSKCQCTIIFNKKTDVHILMNKKRYHFEDQNGNCVDKYLMASSSNSDVIMSEDIPILDSKISITKGDDFTQLTLILL